MPCLRWSLLRACFFTTVLNIDNKPLMLMNINVCLSHFVINCIFARWQNLKKKTKTTTNRWMWFKLWTFFKLVIKIPSRGTYVWNDLFFGPKTNTFFRITRSYEMNSIILFLLLNLIYKYLTYSFFYVSLL